MARRRVNTKSLQNREASFSSKGRKPTRSFECTDGVDKERGDLLLNVVREIGQRTGAKLLEIKLCRKVLGRLQSEQTSLAVTGRFLDQVNVRYCSRDREDKIGAEVRMRLSDAEKTAE